MGSLFWVFWHKGHCFLYMLTSAECHICPNVGSSFSLLVLQAGIFHTNHLQSLDDPHLHVLQAGTGPSVEKKIKSITKFI